MNGKTQAAITVPNFVGGAPAESASGRFLPVTDPSTGETIASVPLSTKGELDDAVRKAAKAQVAWGAESVKDRVQVLFRLKALIEKNQKMLIDTIVRENGKTAEEAAGSVLRAVECVEFASSLPQVAPGGVLEVTRGIECKMVREPLGVVAGITPFNFPFMVPLWMIPLAVGCGNAFILKPSEQTPLSATHIADLLREAGLPAGLFSVVNGDREIVEGICGHPEIKAVGFVGSSKVAEIVHRTCGAAGKKVRALGGAKNHLVVVPDADPEMTATNVVASATGCTGQRCMAASVLLAVGDVEPILDKIQEKMGALRGGAELGPVISAKALERISGYMERAEKGGAKLVVDGRKLVAADAHPGGHWIGACVIDHAKPDHEASCDEIFGPTLTIIRCKTLDEAIEIENANPYGNAAAIYTSSGKAAQLFTSRAKAGMIGVNIGVPVPREPFAFGGWNLSRFGDGDITGESAIDFWTNAKKITTKWSDEFRRDWMS